MQTTKNPTAELKYALVGAGMMGREHISNIKLLPRSRVSAIVDPDADSRAQACALLDYPIACYSDLQDLKADLDFDALVIASPNNLHKDALEYAFSNLGKALLVEKPLCTLSEDCGYLQELSQNYCSPVWVAMEYRYMAPIAQLIHDVRIGMIGDLRLLTIREHRFPFLSKVGDWNRFSAQSGGTMVEKCCHFFDLMRLIFQDEPTKIYASGSMDVNHKDELYAGKRPDIIDNALVTLDFPGGRRALLELCMFAEGSEYQEVITAVGTGAKLEAFVPGPQRFWPDALENPESAPQPYLLFSPREPKGPQRRGFVVPKEILHAGDHQGATYYQHSKFRDCILTGKGVEVSLEDGARAVQIGLAAELSARSGQVVEL